MATKVLFIVGPTAVGKTALSIELAKQFNAEIISGDSMQVYRHLDIGTAKVMPAEQAGIPHHLINICDVDEPFTVAKFSQLAQANIDEIDQRGKLAMIVGGTGYYLQALLAGFQFGGLGEASDPAYRKLLTQQAKTEATDWLWQQLQVIDPLAAQKIAPNNQVRIIRALEYYHTTGQRFSEQADLPNAALDPLIIGLNTDRAVVYQRINQRVDQMMTAGLAKEAHWLYEQGGAALPAGKGIGYHELFPYFDQETDLASAVAQIKQDSRRYAKRQLTWFRNKMQVTWFDPLMSPTATEEIKAKVASWLIS